MFKSNLFHSLMDNGNFRKLMFHIDLGDFVFIPSSILTIRLWNYIENVQALFFIFIKKETVFHTNTFGEIWIRHEKNICKWLEILVAEKYSGISAAEQLF